MKGKQILFLSVFTLITVLVWMFLEVNRTAKKSTVPEVLQEQIQPLSPVFDTAVLKEIRKRQGF